jgi:hypothetical protein
MTCIFSGRLPTGVVSGQSIDCIGLGRHDPQALVGQEQEARG